jgi:signal peptidase I
MKEPKPVKAGKKTGAIDEAAEIVKTIFWALLIALVIRTILFQPYTIPSASEEPNLYQGDYIVVSKWSYGYSRHSILFSPPLFKGRILFHPPTRGDVIVFKLPRDGHTDYIKRLIGMPGDHLQVRNRIVYINGKPLPQTPVGTIWTHDRGFPEQVKLFRETNPEGRSHLIQAHANETGADNTGVYVVPPHCYFMMGDNRDNSLDSRFDPFMPMTSTGSATCAWDESLDQGALTDPDHPGVGFVPEEDVVGKAQFVLASWMPGASLLKPWTWVRIRPDRFFHALK